jgi:hypothetical protein
LGYITDTGLDDLDVNVGNIQLQKAGTYRFNRSDDITFQHNFQFRNFRITGD